MDKIKLICLMPSFNKAKTLEKAIESVMMQKTDFSYKLIILDDCSEDNSYEIAKKYQKIYPQKIDIVRNKKNIKLLRSIMHGYTLLKGVDYFCVLDADDWYIDDHKFAEAVSFLDKHKKYSMYMTNITFKKGDSENLWYKGHKQECDFDFKDRIAGKAFMIQTSGVIYRNLYFKTGQNKWFENVLNLSFPESYRGDGFRFEWYLQGGKAHFENKVTAVYNYDMNGIWSSLTEAEQDLLNAQLLYSCAEFFNNKKSYYTKEARRLYNCAMEKFNNTSDIIFAKNKNIICRLSILLFQKQKKSKEKLKKFLHLK